MSVSFPREKFIVKPAGLVKFPYDDELLVAGDRERALNLLPYDANQAQWRYCTYLVATPCTAAGRGTP